MTGRLRLAALAAVAIIGLAGAALDRILPPVPPGIDRADYLLGLATLWLRTAAGLAGALAVVGLAWLVWRRYRPNLRTPARAIRRGVIRARWASAARSCGLAVNKDRRKGAMTGVSAWGLLDGSALTAKPSSKAGQPASKPIERLPKLDHGHASPDRLTVTWRLRPARGQTIEDVADHDQALADALHVERVVIRRTGPARGELTAYFGNPFHAPRPWTPVVLDHPAIPWGTDENGATTVFPLGVGHALGAGATGSGKSGMVNSLVGSAALRPDVAIVGIDLKRVELGPWRGRMTDLAVDPGRAAALIAELADLVRYRYTLLEQLGLRKMTHAGQGVGPWVLVVIDELSELLDTIDKGDLVSIGRLARACGISLAVFTQRPTAQTLSMDLRDQLDALRWCGRVPPKSTTGDMVLGDDCPLDPSKIDKNLKGLGVLDDADGVRHARPWWLDDETGHLQAVAASVEHLRVPPEAVFPWRTDGSRSAA